MPAHCRFFALRQEEIGLEIGLEIALKIGLKKRWLTLLCHPRLLQAEPADSSGVAPRAVFERMIPG
jgi:hypothetical protein